MKPKDREQIFIERVTELIDINLTNEQFGVSELARKMGMSRTSLHRKVSSATKFSVSQFIRQLRLKKAMELLKQTSLTSSEIAFDVGFRSVSYFSKCFHDHYGFPPGEARKMETTGPVSGKEAPPAGIPKIQIGSVVVLPFDNYTGDDRMSTQVSGMHDALINELGQLGSISVVSKTSASTFSNSGKTIKEIAAELNVEAVLEASVHRANEKIRVQIRLLKALPEEQQLWAQTFDLEKSDIPGFSGLVINSMASEIQLTYPPDHHNLLPQLTNFIGREKEMQVLRNLIREHRLVTVVGTGGCGKTRLACEAVMELVPEYKDGVWFIDLSSLESGELVEMEIAEALGIQEVPGQPIIDTLIAQIKDRHLLIILDNCEHLIKACVKISGILLQSVPGLKILATSRETLNITGEKVWRLPSLTLVDPGTIQNVEDAKSSEAVRLFTDRASLNNPEFELASDNMTDVATICKKIDGIPLAVELVASRTRYMDPQLILKRFADRFEKIASTDPGASNRQKTLQATIDWSYNLLSNNEKTLFTRISVFSGGFDLKAAEEVCSDEQLPGENVLNLLSHLVDCSMVNTKTGTDHSLRYYRLETLKQYGLDNLRKRNEEEIFRKRHLNYFMALAEEAYQNQYEEQLKYLNRIEADDDNLIAALDWSEEHLPEKFCLLSGTLAWYWKVKSKMNLGRNYLQRAKCIESGKPEVHARILQGLGLLAWYSSSIDDGIKFCEESLNIWRKLKDLQQEAHCLATLCELHRDEKHDFESGLKYGERALIIARKIGKPGFINHCLISVCQSLVHSKQFEKGLPYVEELIDSSESLEQPMGILYARHFHSDCALGIKDFKEAEKRYTYGIEVASKYGNEWFQLIDMQGAAFAVSGQGRWEKCLRLNAASTEKATSMGIVVYGMIGFWTEWIDTHIGEAKQAVGEVLTRKYEEEGIAMGFEKAIEYALDPDRD